MDSLVIASKIDQSAFRKQAQTCYEKYGQLPIKFRDKSGLVLDQEQILELAVLLGLINKH